MEKQQLLLISKPKFGKTWIYPGCKESEYLLQLIKRKVFTPKKLEELKSRYKITVEPLDIHSNNIYHKRLR